MHPQAYAYVERTVRRFPEFRNVVDLGGRDINGLPKALFGRYCSYTGVDITPGVGVAFVANAADWQPPAGFPPIDCVVSTELFEHTPQGREIVANAFSLLKPGGWFITTMAGRDRPPHNAWGEAALRPDEYYGNVEEDDFRSWLEEAGFVDIEIEYHFYLGHGGDLYAVARKP